MTDRKRERVTRPLPKEKRAEVSVTLTAEEREAIEQACDIPLYRKPMLADEELKAIRRAAAVAREMHDSRLEAALGGLLERLC
jgi:hypothetical protein